MPPSSSHKPSRNPNRRRFFKVMAPGFKTKLYIPPSFCKHVSLKRSRKAVVTTVKGSWRIDVCKNIENGQLYFESGWDIFVQNHNLKVFDFLLFEQLENLSFQVRVFDYSTNCEKQFHSIEKASKDPNPHKSQKMVYVDHTTAVASPYFRTTIKPTHIRKRAPCLTIPVTFWRSHDDLSRQHSVLLRGPSRELQMVRLIKSTRTIPQLTMGAGWQEFYKSYNLQLGDDCRFTINGRTDDSIIVMDVEINPSS